MNFHTAGFAFEPPEKGVLATALQYLCTIPLHVSSLISNCSISLAVAIEMSQCWKKICSEVLSILRCFSAGKFSPARGASQALCQPKTVIFLFWKSTNEKKPPNY